MGADAFRHAGRGKGRGRIAVVGHSVVRSAEVIKEPMARFADTVNDDGGRVLETREGC